MDIGTFSAQPEHWRFVRWLYDSGLGRHRRPQRSCLILRPTQLLEQKILLPGVSVLERLVATVRERVAQRVWTLLSRLPDADEQCRQLNGNSRRG